MLYHRHQVLTAPDGHNIQVQIWQPENEACCIFHVLHGLGEYGNRYGRFASSAVERGYAVCVHDHRGHGEFADEPGHFADSTGWHKINSDTEIVHDFIREQFQGAPIVLLGHSMGSYLAQVFAMHYGPQLSALILSASTWPSKVQLAPLKLLAHIESWRLGIRGKSALLDKLGFGNFNKPFLPARTELDWLSRDEAEVDKYVADPLCGGPYSCGLWLDLIGGLFSVCSDHAVTRVPYDLPILITGGESDPIGGDKGMTKLAMHYAQTSHQRLSVKIYPGGRHEMLNEINRDEVTADWLNWVAATTHTGRSG